MSTRVLSHAIAMEPCPVTTDDVGCNYHLGNHTGADDGATHLSVAYANADGEKACAQVSSAMLLPTVALLDDMFAGANIDIDDALHEVLTSGTS